MLFEIRARNEDVPGIRRSGLRLLEAIQIAIMLSKQNPTIDIVVIRDPVQDDPDFILSFSDGHLVV